MRGWTVLTLIGGTSLLAAAGGAAYGPAVPLGLRPEAAVVADDPRAAEKAALGKLLFWDPRWSTSGTVACVSCHRPDHGWSDPRRFSLDFAGRPTRRHAPTIVNRVFGRWHLWTGLRDSLESQARLDGNQSPETLVRRLGAVPEYRRRFRAVFGTDLEPDGVAEAIAAYVRTILSGNSPYDRFVAGDAHALSPAARRGLALFNGKALCVICHAGFNFTDEGFHNTGVGMDRDTPDPGRAAVNGNESDSGSFKTPTLRDVARRGPYMHDGSLRSLEDVIAFYNGGGIPNPWLSPQIRPLDLTEAEQADLVAFLHALSGDVGPQVSAPPELPP